MNILVLGNGFDLAHNLPTEYKHFILFMKQICAADKERTNYKSRKINNDSIINYLLECKECHDEDKEITKLISMANEGNVWIKHFDNQIKQKNWVDFEKRDL